MRHAAALVAVVLGLALAGPGAAEFHDLEPVSPGGVVLDAPPLPPRPGPEPPVVTLRLSEETLGVRHTRTAGARGYIYERAILPLAAQTLTFDRPVQGSAWHVFREGDAEGPLVAVDSDLPPVNTDLPRQQRRALGQQRCYRVRAVTDTEDYLSEPVCTRTRGIDWPFIVRITEVEPRSVNLRWSDNSELEQGYRYVVRRVDSGVIVAQGTTGPDVDGPIRIGGLNPNRPHRATVTTFDEHGTAEFSRSFRTARTD